jgi:hypothetical protein
MGKNIKIILGLAAAGIVVYLVLKPKKALPSVSKKPILGGLTPTDGLPIENLPIENLPIEDIVKVPIFNPNTGELDYDTIIGTPIQVPVVEPVYSDSYFEAKSNDISTPNDTFGGLIINNNVINPQPSDYIWNSNSSGSLDFKLGINENYKYR